MERERVDSGLREGRNSGTGPAVAAAVGDNTVRFAVAVGGCTTAEEAVVDIVENSTEGDMAAAADREPASHPDDTAVPVDTNPSSRNHLLNPSNKNLSPIPAIHSPPPAHAHSIQH